MRFVDTHCHLDHHDDLTAAEQVRRAHAADVGLLVTVGTDVASSQQALVTASRHEGVWAAVGIHPNDADGADEDALRRIEELAGQPRCVAVGETGLDYFRDHTTPDEQHASFRAHVEIARRSGRTLMIHCRDAWDDCLAILEDVGAPERVVMHCFSGDVPVAARCVAAGYYLSFAGNVTFTNAPGLREAAAAVPVELLLTETDAPYLTPHPHRGTPNEPAYVPLTTETLAGVHGCGVDELAAQVRANADRAFRLPEDADGPAAGAGG